MSDFRLKLAALGRGQASIADMANARDVLITDAPDAVNQAQTLLDAALKAGMPASLYSDLSPRLPTSGDETVLRDSSGTNDTTQRLRPVLTKPR